MSAFETCPVCGERWFEPPAHCACGYHVAARDPVPAIAHLRRRVRSSNRTFALGIGLLLAIPASCLGAAAWAPQLIMFALFAIPFELGFGAALTIAGIIRGERYGNRLDAAQALMQLPAARVIE